MQQRDWYQVLGRLNLNQLLTFIVVSEEKSFRGAAARMHMSQSAVSVQVRLLEAALEVALFHRTTRSVSLTREGAMLMSVVRRMTKDLLETVVALKEQAQLQRGVVTVIALPTFAHILMPPLMRRYADLYPKVEVRLLDMDSQDALLALRNGDADMAVMSRTGDMEGFDYVPLFTDEFVVLLPASSPIFHGQSEVTVEEVAREPLVLSPKGAQTRVQVEEIFHAAGCTPIVRQECQRPQTLLALVENGFGCAVLPRTTVADINLSRLRIVRLKDAPSRESGIVTLHGLTPSPAARSLTDFMRTAPLQALVENPLPRAA